LTRRSARAKNGKTQRREEKEVSSQWSSYMWIYH